MDGWMDGWMYGWMYVCMYGNVMEWNGLVLYGMVW